MEGQVENIVMEEPRGETKECEAIDRTTASFDADYGFICAERECLYGRERQKLGTVKGIELYICPLNGLVPQ